MASAYAIGVNRPAQHRAPHAMEPDARTLRWSYRRDGEVVTCALGLTPDHAAYELRVSPPRSPLGPASELFDDPISAFQRLATFERSLLGDGWFLERFEHGGRRGAT